MGSLSPAQTKVEEWLHNCIRCGNCKYVFRVYVPSCPSGEYFNFETYFASGKIRLAQAFEKDEIEWDESMLEPIFTCTTCGNCEVQCLAPHREHIVDIIEELRNRAVDALGPLEAHEKFKRSIKENHNPYGEEHHALKVREEYGFPEKAEYVYFIGCTANYRETQIRDATISVLKKIGLDFTVVDEHCCCSPLLRTGQASIVRDIAEHNIEVIRETGASKVITSCAGCFRTLKRDYERIGMDYAFDVLHITQLLENCSIESLQEDSVPSTWHDPCHLGRHMGIYDEPRKTLDRLKIDYEEMRTNREDSWCCGAGGGVKSAFKEFSSSTAQKRVEDAEAVGAKRIITACPFCVRSLRQPSEEKGIEVLDITEVVQSLISKKSD